MAYNLGDAIGYIRLNIADFMSKCDQIQRQSAALDSTVSALGGTFSGMATKATAAIAAVASIRTIENTFKSIVAIGSSFEASMSQVAATMGMSADAIANNAEEYQKLTAAAQEMGATTKFTASEAAQALNYLALAGYGVDDSLEMLPQVLNAAAAGGMDLASASDMITDAMSALGLSIDEAGTFIDQMAKTAQSSNTSVAQLGDAILQIGGTAKMLVGGTTELNTALGILANNGIKAAEGGTALRQILLNLTAPTEKAQKFMDSIGFSAYDAAGNMKPLNQTFAELDEILRQTASDQERQKIITEIFDARQLKSANALLANYGEAWDDLYTKISQADGAASTMSDTMQQNLQGAMTIANSAIEAVANTVYNGLQVNLTKAVVSATDSIGKLNEELGSPKMQESLRKISEGFGSVVDKLTTFATDSVVPKIIDWLSRLDETADRVKETAVGLGVALPIVAAGLIACNESVQIAVAQFIALKGAAIAANAALVLNPYTAVAAAIGLVVAAVVRWNDVYKERHDQMQEEFNLYREESEHMEQVASAWNSAKTQYEEAAAANNEQITKIETLNARLGEFASKTNLTASEQAQAKQIIEELNEIYPTEIELIDGVIVGYDKATQSLKGYCEQLKYQAILEAKNAELNAAYVAQAEAENALPELERAMEDANKELDVWQKKWDKYNSGINNYTETDRKAAAERGMTVKQYIKSMYDASVNSAAVASKAWSEAKQTYGEATDTIKEAERNWVVWEKKAGNEELAVYEDKNEAIRETNQRAAREREQQARDNAKALAEAEQEAAGLSDEEREAKTEDQLARLADLDNQYKRREIASEKDLWAEKNKIFEEGWDVNNDKLITQYSRMMDFNDQQAEKEKQQIEKSNQSKKKAYEDGIKDQIEELERRQELDDTYTKTMMYDELQVIADGLDKESDLWKDLNYKIQKGRKDLEKELETTNGKILTKEEKTAEAHFKTWSNSYNKIISEAERAAQSIQQKQDNLANKLTNSVDLYEAKTKKVFDAQEHKFVEKEVFEGTAKSLNKQVTELDKYTRTLDKLESKGVSQNLMSKILGMDADEGQKFAEMLNNMSSSQLEAYNKSYDELVNKNKAFAEKYYQSEIDAFNKNYKDKIDNILHNVPGDVKLVGEDTMNGFMEGLTDKEAESTGLVKDLMKSIVDQTKETLGVHSPSVVYQEIGKNLNLGLMQGVEDTSEDVVTKFTDLGTASGEGFVSSFMSQIQTFLTAFPQTLSGLSATAATANQVSSSFLPYTGYAASSQIPYYTQMNQTAGINTLTRADIVQAIQEAQPSGDVILQVDGQQFAQVSRKSLNTYASQSGNMGLSI